MAEDVRAEFSSIPNAVYFAAHLRSSDKFVHLLLQTLIGSEQLELE